MPLMVRRACLEEAEQVADVFLHARATMTYLPRLHTEAETRAWMAGHVLINDEVWVAEGEGEIVGFLALHGDWVDHLYILPEYQRQGIGRLLITKAKERLPQGMQLWAFQKNTQARRFYEAQGFVLSKLTDGADNEEREPDALYVWKPFASEA